MDFQINDYEPVVKNWLELNLCYEGNGMAEFNSPEGTVQGKAVATLDEYGNTSIEIAPDLVSVADPSYAPFGLGFLFGSKVEESDGCKSLSFGGLHNPCGRLSIVTPGGTFASTGAVHLTGLSSGTKQQKPLRFYVREASFETGNQKPPKFFAMPLFNCLADLNSRLMGDHPLRIYPTPQVPTSLPERDKMFATLKANAKNNLIAFLMEGKLCFVERLPDYDSRLESLKKGAQRRVTAVLVGELANTSISTLADFWSWFPFELFSALGFASGIEVGLPWIEIRDEAGGLIRRLHGRPALPHYWEGDALLQEFDTAGSMGGLGEFLTRYLTLPSAQRSYLEVVMDHARLGSIGAPLRLYDIVDHLMRALECLCREHGFTEQDLLSGLDGEVRNQAKAILSEATKRIAQLQVEARTAGRMEDHRLLSTILGRAANAGTTEKKFGLSVVDLLQRFGLPDAEIIDRFLASHPRKDGLHDWTSVLTCYRNATIHEGYMDFEKKHDIDDVARICTHVKDLITRLVFQESRYSGTYESPLLPSSGPQPVDWIKEDTDPSRLGFT